MIIVSQGHEQGIGLEIFLKSFSLLSKEEQEYVTLITHSQTLKAHLQELNIKYSISSQKKNYHLNLSNNILKVYFFDEQKKYQNQNLSQTMGALLCSMDHVSEKDILITLPSSKDQFLKKDGPGQKQEQEQRTYHLGHTEFFRHHYNQDHLPMFFYSSNYQLLLLSDHLPLKDVSTYLTTDLIVKKVSITLEQAPYYNIVLREVIVAGLNPHAGEDGLLGHEEEKIIEALHILKEKFPKHNIIGPYPADSLLSSQSLSPETLIVYPYHDQGLTPFKTTNSLLGINITFGLPYLRMSVDHGTAFDLKGKNKANYQSSYYLFKKAMQFLKN